ncbi:hypothetical protein AGLY_001103, partial [Aphis glycines]
YPVQAVVGHETGVVQPRTGQLYCCTRARVDVPRLHPLKAKVRLKIKATKCYRCLCFGHTKHSCSGPDRTNMCSLCTEMGHKAVDCTANPRCTACLDIGEEARHYSGSSRCVAHKRALLPGTSKTISGAPSTQNRGANILILSEYYNCNGIDCYSDTDKRASIELVSSLSIQDLGREEPGFRWIKIGGIRIYSCYWSPNTDIKQYEHFILRLELSVRGGRGEVIIAGDFNAHHTEWGCPKNNKRGEILSNMIHALGLLICNKGKAPTFQRGFSTSIIDLTIASPGTADRMQNWSVLDENTLSDYNYIEFVIKNRAVEDYPPTIHRTNIRELEKAIEEGHFEVPDTYNMDANQYSEAMVQAIKDKSTTTIDPRAKHRRSVHWWTHEIADLRKEANHARRVYQRKLKKTGRGECVTEEERAKLTKLNLVKAIKRSKEQAWKRLCDLVDREPWGKAYKIVMGKLQKKRPIPELTTPGRLEKIISGLFPTHRDREKTNWPSECQRQATSEAIRPEELATAVSSLKRNKAPGLDGVTNEMVKLVARKFPDMLLTAYNKCLFEGKFPIKWKTARLVLIRKGDKPLNEPSSYRPICLLDCLGKGSVLGPTLWNVLYDDLLRVPLPEGVEYLAFADDVVLVATAKEPYELEGKLTTAAGKVSSWLESIGLKLAAHKSEVVVITRMRKHNDIKVTIGGTEIKSSSSIKYLGIQIDAKMIYTEHAKTVANKAGNTLSNLGRIMPNLSAARQNRRRLLAGVIHSQLLYGAESWAEDMSQEGWKQLGRVQRKAALRVASAYRTVSKEAILVVSGVIPIDIMAIERRRSYLQKRGEQEPLDPEGELQQTALDKWQSRWEGTEEAEERQWTRRLIRDIREWTGRKHGEVDFHITQALTGHGCFAQYLHRFGLLEEACCWFCGHLNDDPNHTFFECDAWHNKRRELNMLIGEEVTAENLVSNMIHSKDKWNAISNYIHYVLTKKENEERRRKGLPVVN